MSDATQTKMPTQPLRRIVKPTPVARQRKMTIGRIAANSQLMANSFGRSTSIRRSFSNESSVRFPTWLLPALPPRADDLDPYRDRDLIALRQSRMKNRVVRQVQPRGLPMAAHAHGRSRSGVQTGPSSIARRLHPIRRQPNKNEAHIGPSSMPFVRVATQPQRPTARPPRTRSTSTPARNGNRTDRDGPAPRLAARNVSESSSQASTTPERNTQASSSLATVNRRVSRTQQPGDLDLTHSSEPSSFVARSTPFESVMVARSLLSTTNDSSRALSSSFTSESVVPAHRLSLPRVSSRQSVDRSAIHRRSISTKRAPLMTPSSRIPLSMLYQPPQRQSPSSAGTSRAGTSPSASRSAVISRKQGPVAPRQSVTLADLTAQVSRAASTKPPAKTESATTGFAGSSTPVAPTSTSAASAPSISTNAAASSSAAQQTAASSTSVSSRSTLGSPGQRPTSTPEWTSFPTRDAAPSDIARSTAISAQAAQNSATTASNLGTISSSSIVATTTDSTSAPLRAARATTDRSQSLQEMQPIRRRVRAFNVPRTAGWRQVVGLSPEHAITPTPAISDTSQDSLFRRVAALANPTGAPLGTPGDIARRAPVSGSLISIASSMHAAIGSNSATKDSLQSSGQSSNQSTRQRDHRLAPAAATQRKTSTRTNRATSQTSESVVSRAASNQVSSLARSKQSTDHANRNRSESSNVARRLNRRGNNSSQSRLQSRPKVSQLANRAQRQSSLRSESQNSSVVANQQRPTFSHFWSSVKHSAPRQSHLIARQSLRLPQTRVHSLSSKPGSILRQQFGLTQPLTETRNTQSARSMAHSVNRRNTRRSNLALRIGAQAHPSTDRVMSVARKTRSHMSTVTPGASGGIQFAGSLAKAVSYRQTHGVADQTLPTNRQVRRSTSHQSQPTTAPSVRRSIASSSATTATSPASWSGSSGPITGSGSDVAQNFLARLSRKTGEDFAPLMTSTAGASIQDVSSQDVSAQISSTPSSVHDGTIARRASRPTLVDRSARSSLTDVDQADGASNTVSVDGEPHWAMSRSTSENSEFDTDDMSSRAPSAADASERASRAMTESASVTNGSLMRSVATRRPGNQSDSHSTRHDQSTSSTASSDSSTPGTTSAARSSRAHTAEISLTTSAPVSQPKTRRAEASRSRQEIVERGGSIASRGVLHRAVSRSVPTQRLSSPLNDLPVSPNVSPGMRIPSEAFSALPSVPAVARASSSSSISPDAASSSSGASVSRSNTDNAPVVSRSASNPPSRTVRRDGHRSVSIRRQASGVQFGPSEDGTISADALVRMIESGQSIPNRVVHRQVSGTSSSGLMRRPTSPDRISRTASTTIQRSTSLAEKAAPGPVSILSQVLAPSSDSETGTSQITTSQLLDLMDWINRIVDDRLRQELERRGVAGGRW